jgi:hypothetical protein
MQKVMYSNGFTHNITAKPQFEVYLGDKLFMPEMEVNLKWGFRKQSLK